MAIIRCKNLEGEYYQETVRKKITERGGHAVIYKQNRKIWNEKNDLMIAYYCT